MFDAFLAHLERGPHRKNRLAVLDRIDAPRRKTLAVADAVGVEDDGDERIAGQDEIGVQRMRRATHGARRGDERLRDHLAPEHALPTVLAGERPPKDVDLDRFEIKTGDEIGGGGTGMANLLEARSPP